MELIKVIEQVNKTAKVYLDREWGEYTIKFYIDGKYQKDADYFTDTLSDAVGTSFYFVNN